MTLEGEPAVPQNPFSASRVRPGAMAYQFPPGQTAATLIERLRRNGWCGQIVGPHGSGKSALVATLIDRLDHSGQKTVLVELHDDQRRLPGDFWRIPERDPGTILFVDGYEQLARWSRFRLRCFCRRRRLGLVVTAHTSVGFPDLFRTTTSLRLVRQIVSRLVEGHGQPFTMEEVNDRFGLCRGDLREILFDLYDLYEQRRPRGDASTDATAS